MHDSELRNKINKNLQERLIKLREDKNVTQAVVSESTGISRTSIVAYEKGTSIPDLEKLYLLAEYYGVSSDYLLGRNEGTELDINYIIEETGLNETAINQLKMFNEDEYFRLEIFAINKIIEFSSKGNFLEFFGKYISSPNIDRENGDLYKLISPMKSGLFLPDGNISYNKKEDNAHHISPDEFLCYLMQKEFQQLVENIKKNKDTKQEFRNHFIKIILSYFKERDDKNNYIDYEKLNDDEVLMEAINQLYLSKEKKRNK